jgi:hypothetical protein
MGGVRGGVVGLMVGFAALISAGSTHAAAPVLLSVGQQARHPIARFGSMPGADVVAIYLAAKPDRGPDGKFLPENVKEADLLTNEEIAAAVWIDEDQVNPGLYYVMGRAADVGCNDPACVNGFSNVLTLRIPKPAQRYRATVKVLRYARVAHLTLAVTPLGETLPYRVCWTLRGTPRRRCARGRVSGHSWNRSASDLRRVSLRRMRKVTTFTWYVRGRRVAVKRVRVG